MSIHLQRDTTGKLRQRIRIDQHQLFADAKPQFGGEDSAPGPHDIFDAALAACKAITLMMYAQRKNLALESVDVDIERDASKEGQGHYGLAVALTLNGDLSAEEKQKLAEIADRCPIHKLMSQAEISITTTLSN